MAAHRQSAAWWNVVAKVGGAGFWFFLYLVLARTLEPQAFADVAVVLAWLAIAMAVACLSAPLVMVRFVSDHLASGRYDLAKGVIQLSVAVTLAFASVATLLVLLAIVTGTLVLPRDLSESAMVGAVLLPPSVFLLNLAGLLIGVKRAASAELLSNMLRPAVVIGCVGVFWVLQKGGLSAPAVLTIYLAATFASLVGCAVFAFRVLPLGLIKVKPAFQVHLWMRAAAGFLAVSVMSTLHDRIDLLILGAVGLPLDVVAYAVAARFSQTVVLAAAATGSAMAPHFVEGLADLQKGRRGNLQRLVRDTARTALYVSLIGLAAFALLGPYFLQLFGPNYERAYMPMVLLAFGQAISAVAGPAAAVATLAGKPRIAIVSFAVGILVNVLLGVALIPVLGASGSALAAAAAMVAAAMVAWLGVKKSFLVDTSIFGAAQVEPAS